MVHDNLFSYWNHSYNLFRDQKKDEKIKKSSLPLTGWAT
ncbi:hypothetical protein LbDm2_2482 [Levilactobacillus brevis]|nr:hypothetical protein LbDm2_2482 [Levilactobacillus brevis]